MTQTHVVSSASQPIATLLIDALRTRDYSSLAAPFHAYVRSRLLIPRGLLTPADRPALIAAFQQWFGDADRFELEQSDANQIGARLSLRYNIRLREHAVWYVVEQQTYSTLQDGAIRQFDLVCSGFQPC